MESKEKDGQTQSEKPTFGAKLLTIGEIASATELTLTIQLSTHRGTLKGSIPLGATLLVDNYENAKRYVEQMLLRFFFQPRMPNEDKHPVHDDRSPQEWEEYLGQAPTGSYGES